MAPKKKKPTVTTKDYRHDTETRTNIPPAKIASEGLVPQVEKVTYSYSPHLSPRLQFDPSGETVHEPWLEWAGRREEQSRGVFEVDPVALHIHERVSAQAVVRTAAREDIQRDLFADPAQPYREAVQFYQHDVDWANRLILGDSLQVMASLARREGLAGKVQMVYVDPPYGIRFSSNFQPELRRRTLQERDKDLTREAETVRAYRDTWQLGVHSYLSYLRTRLILARELLAPTGSIFVQISDTNVHLVRSLLDDIFRSGEFRNPDSNTDYHIGDSQDPTPRTRLSAVVRQETRTHLKFNRLVSSQRRRERQGTTLVSAPPPVRMVPLVRMTQRERSGLDSIPERRATVYAQ